MGKRAVIYVRTSSEQQAEKCSPMEQETECREFAEKQGLVVVNVYRDIERYRFKNKWVEPSGTRYDRPGFLAMLRDAADDQFDVVLAWREDRLYRGMRAMLLFLEAVQQHKLEVVLALETFDLSIAPLKAWLAQVELDNIKERMTMGVKARLKSGRANSGQDRYGYRRVGGNIEIFPEEAKWVKQIFSWYLENISLREIRKRLIAENAPQKEAPTTRRIRWSHASIQSILAAANEYASGIKIQKRDGESFQIQTVPILDPETYKKFMEIRTKRNIPSVDMPKRDFLIRHLLFCPCGYRMVIRTSPNARKHWDGQWESGKVWGHYGCKCQHEELVSPDCPRTVKNAEADENVWNQVCDAISHPDILIEQARNMVEELKQNIVSYGMDRGAVEKELDTPAVGDHSGA